MNPKTCAIFCSGLLAFSGSAQAVLTAGDSALNYITNSDWRDGDNFGDGFNQWEIFSNSDDINDFADTFLGDSTAGAGDINTSGQSFGMYAYGDLASVRADRFFVSPLEVNTVFTFQMALNADNGLKGMYLYAGAPPDPFDPFDLANVFGLEVANGDANVVAANEAILNPGSGAGYDYGGDDAVLDFIFTINSATSLSYNISRTSSQGEQGTLFSGTVSDLPDSITGFGFFVTGTDSAAAENHLYVNNFAVVPEPSVIMAGTLGLLACTLRRRRNAA